MAENNQITIKGATYEIRRNYVGKKTIREILIERIASSGETIAFDNRTGHVV